MLYYYVDIARKLNTLGTGILAGALRCQHWHFALSLSRLIEQSRYFSTMRALRKHRRDQWGKHRHPDRQFFVALVGAVCWPGGRS